MTKAFGPDAGQEARVERNFRLTTLAGVRPVDCRQAGWPQSTTIGVTESSTAGQ
ncbi:MAG: hypothetical protein ABSG95_01305 [Solirubrobacteraceae bacterium]